MVDESDTAVTYTPRYGYAMGELGNDMTALEMRDLRSWLQTPVLRVKSLIAACSDSSKNGGWTVNLDPAFFNTSNPYYNDAWITLPAISDLEYAGYDLHEGGFTLGTVAWNGWSGTYPVNVTGSVDTTEMNNPFFNFSFTISENGLWPNDIYYTSKQYGQSRGIIQVFTNYFVQLVAYDEGNRVVAASNVYNFTTPKGGEYIPLSWYRSNGSSYGASYTPAGGVNREEVILGEFHKKTENLYEFVSTSGRDWNISLGQNISYSYLRLLITKVGVMRGNGGYGWTYQSINNANPAGLDYIYFADGYGEYGWMPQQAMHLVVNSSEAQYPTGEQIASGANIPKEKLLKSENTPAEYLIGYTKLFGLYYNVHIDEKVVDIMLRNNYYNGNVRDINKFIDRGKEMKIVPLSYDKKFYDLRYKEDNGSMFLEQYKDTYNKTYGQQRINTSYEFNNDSKNLLDSIPYQSAVEALEKSKYYRDLYTRRLSRPIWTIDEWQYTLWAYVDDEQKSYSKDMPAVQPNTAATYWSTLDGYDIFPKLQFRDKDNSPVDCKNVLVFFNGFQSLTNAKGATIPFWLTDENDAMLTINEGKPCWLYTERDTDKDNNNIATRVTSLPVFGRYRMNNNQIDLSWDFGEPLELYNPTYVSNPQSTIYNQYWKDYITDLYSENTRVVTCYVYNSRPLTKQDLRYFYYFDNSYWVINKIIDYNPNKQLTKMEFVKVNNTMAYTTNLSIDSNDYLNVMPTNINFTNDLDTFASIQTNLHWGAYIVYEDTTGDTFNASISPTTVDLVGGTALLTINASTGLSWTITKESWMNTSVTAGTGSSTVNITIPESSSSRTGSLVVSGSNGSSSSFTITQQTSSPSVVPSSTAYTINTNSSGVVYTVAVAANVPYTVSADTDWLSASTTNGGVAFKALSNNTGTTPRNSVISLIYSGSEEATITVSQMAEIVSNWALFSNNTTAITYTFSSAATIGDFVEEAMTSNVEYTVVSNQDWLSAETTSSGIQFTVLSENTTGEERQGTVSVKYNGETLAVATIKQQEEEQVLPYVAADTNLVEFGYSDSGWSWKTVNISANQKWTATTTTGFILNPNFTALTGDGYIQVRPTQTGSTDLTGSITISGESGQTATVNLIRYKPSVMCTSGYTTDCHATSFTVYVTAMTDFTVVSEDETWLVASITGGTSATTGFTVTVSKNTDDDKPDAWTELPSRSGNIELEASYLGYTTKQHCTIKQYRSNLFASLGNGGVFPYYSGNTTLTITAVTGSDMPAWEIIAPSWITLPQDLIGNSGTTPTSITIEYSSTQSSRQDTLVVRDMADNDFKVELVCQQPYVTKNVSYDIEWKYGGNQSLPVFHRDQYSAVTSISFDLVTINWWDIDAGANNNYFNFKFDLIEWNDDYSDFEQIGTWLIDSQLATPSVTGSNIESSLVGVEITGINIQNYTNYELRTTLEPKPRQSVVVNYNYSGSPQYNRVFNPEREIVIIDSISASASCVSWRYGQYTYKTTVSGVQAVINWGDINQSSVGKQVYVNISVTYYQSGTKTLYNGGQYITIPASGNSVINISGSYDTNTYSRDANPPITVSVSVSKKTGETYTIEGETNKAIRVG